MPFKLKIRKYVWLPLVLFLIFKIVSGTFAYVKCFDDHGLNLPTVFSNSAVYKDIVLLTGEIRKALFFSSPTDFNDSLIGQAFSADICESKSFYHLALFNYRRGIYKAIPHIFNGGKYKYNSHST